MAIEKMSTNMYADKYGSSRQQLIYRIKKGLNISGVINVEMIGTRYLLHVDSTVCNNDAKIKSKKSFDKRKKRLSLAK